MFRDRCILANVDGDVPRIHTLLDLAHLGVFTTATEQAGRLNTEVSNLHTVADNQE